MHIYSLPSTGPAGNTGYRTQCLSRGQQEILPSLLLTAVNSGWIQHSSQFQIWFTGSNYCTYGCRVFFSATGDTSDSQGVCGCCELPSHFFQIWALRFRGRMVFVFTVSVALSSLASKSLSWKVTLTILYSYLYLLVLEFWPWAWFNLMLAKNPRLPVGYTQWAIDLLLHLLLLFLGINPLPKQDYWSLYGSSWHSI